MMPNKLLEKVGAHFAQLSPREQALAAAVAALAALMLVFTVAGGAVRHIRELDRTVDRLQEDIVNYRYQIAHRQEVDAMYARVAKQHSSKWSEAEIHDRLRQEIYRLAQLNPPPLDENGIPMRITSGGGALVDIPTLRQGVLKDGGGEFREYQLGFRMDRANFGNVLAFIERLQNSPQSLRIDDLVISRAPTQNEVGVRMEITRTVVGGAPEGATGEDAFWLQFGDAAPLDPEAWRATQCTLTPNEEFAFHDQAALEAAAAAPGATFYFEREVESGFSYDMFIEVAAFGEGTLAVADLPGAKNFDTPHPMPGDGKPYRYHLRFTVPGQIGGITRLRTPAIQLNTQDGRAIVSQLVIRKAVV